MAIETQQPIDVLIAGAGPAGAHLGFLLARQGVRVAIIEQSRLPRDKICGGGVSRKAVELLDMDLGPVVHQWIAGAHLCYPGRASVLKTMDPPAGCTVLRREFDQFLLERARAAGAQFFAETRFVDVAVTRDVVSVQTNRGDFRCRLLVGADGIASTVRGKVFGRRLVHYVPALEALVPMRVSAAEPLNRRVLFDFGALPHGYGWIFPKRDHLNIGVYSPFGARQLRRHLTAFIAQYAAMCAPADVEYFGFPIPVRNVQGRFQTDHVWLLGDAAGFADGLFGEGIYFALKSAALAARAIGETGLAARSTRYTELVKETLQPELRASLWLGKALYAFPGFAFARLVSNPSVNERFAGLISGAVGYRQCLYKTLMDAPKWLFSRAKVHRQAPSFDLPRR